jgi:hypothetical protein
MAKPGFKEALQTHAQECKGKARQQERAQRHKHEPKITVVGTAVKELHDQPAPGRRTGDANPQEGEGRFQEDKPGPWPRPSGRSETC